MEAYSPEAADWITLGPIPQASHLALRFAFRVALASARPARIFQLPASSAMHLLARQKVVASRWNSRCVPRGPLGRPVVTTRL